MPLGGLGCINAIEMGKVVKGLVEQVSLPAKATIQEKDFQNKNQDKAQQINELLAQNLSNKTVLDAACSKAQSATNSSPFGAFAMT